jgi:pimeloyl-ACP methyl ester carboxylesterase
MRVHTFGIGTIGMAILFAAAVEPQASQPTITPTTVSTQPVAMPRDALIKIYQHDLGPKFDPAQADQLIKTHALIEDYFARPTDRKAILEQIEATKIDPNILGQLTRIRMHWPQLAGGVYYINERFGPYKVHYFLGIPSNYDCTKPWPLVIKLPAADPFVKDPKPTADEVALYYRDWMDKEMKQHGGVGGGDAIVLMPLLNLDELYGPSYAGMNTVIQPMKHAYDRVNIDPTRVYLVGHSMSAHATWNLSLHYPTYFAAFEALAGGASQEFQRVRVMNLRNVLPVVWHDANDKVINVKASRDLVRIIRAQKIDVDFEETKGVGHVPTDDIVERAYQKMRARVRELYPKHITMQSTRPDTIFNRIDWLQVYQPLRSGDEHWLFFSRGRGHMTVYQNTYTIDATLGANRIDIRQDNVAQLRIYVNDQMIDFKEPVSVVINKKGVFESLVKPSVEEMLKDQLFIGRGWRYFTGVIDIDLAPKAVTRPATATTGASS